MRLLLLAVLLTLNSCGGVRFVQYPVIDEVPVEIPVETPTEIPKPPKLPTDPVGMPPSDGIDPVPPIVDPVPEPEIVPPIDEPNPDPQPDPEPQPEPEPDPQPEPEPEKYGVIKLKWDANTESDLAGYTLFYGSISGGYSVEIDLGNVTEYTLEGLLVGETYFLALDAYDTSGNHSGYSAEVFKTVTPKEQKNEAT